MGQYLLFNLTGLFSFFLIAIIGWGVFSLLSIPVPAMLGAMTIVVIFRVFDWPLSEPHICLFPFLQIMLGLYIGSKYSSRVIKDLAALISPASIIAGWVIVGSLSLGYLLHILSEMSFLTAFLASVPGGMAESGVIALAVGADVSIVMMFQVLRVFISLTLFSLIISSRKRVDVKTRIVPKKVFSHGNLFIRSLKLAARLKREIINQPWINLIKGVTIAITGGLIGRYIRFPAGELFGAMLFVMALNIAGVPVHSPPNWVRKIIELGIGGVIGFGFSAELLVEAADSYWLALLMMVIILCSSYLMAVLLKKVTNWNFHVCLISCVPAGIAAMTMLAESQGIDPIKVSILHLTRVFTIKLMVAILIIIL